MKENYPNFLSGHGKAFGAELSMNVYSAYELLEMSSSNRPLDTFHKASNAAHTDRAHCSLDVAHIRGLSIGFNGWLRNERGQIGMLMLW